MGSIDMGYFLNMSPAHLMIKIWEFSEHVHHSSLPDRNDCNCQEYLNLCIDAAREVWDKENYIFFDSALYRFQFHRKKLVCLMSLKNEDFKDQLVESILRGERQFFLCVVERNDNYQNYISRKIKCLSVYV